MFFHCLKAGVWERGKGLGFYREQAFADIDIFYASDIEKFLDLYLIAMM